MAVSLILSRPIAALRALQLCTISKSMLTHPSHSNMNQSLYLSPIDAEPLHRYKPGGYHPIKLGDHLKSGRYKVLHKLGWGGYSTVWAARDQRLYKTPLVRVSHANINVYRDMVYVDIKICVAERDREIRELQTMKIMRSCHPRLQYTVHTLDFFNIQGPNGEHKCLVYELLGPNIPGTINTLFSSGRLPGRLAKAIAKQALIGLDDLHKGGIGNGDLHTRNLAFTIPQMSELSEKGFIDMLGTPKSAMSEEGMGKPWELPYLNILFGLLHTGIIDFGESFLYAAAPKKLHTFLPLRAPEVIFQDHVDYRVDLWSMGCMLFELFTRQPPFHTFMITHPVLVRQMQDMASDVLPARWHNSWDRMKEKDSGTPEPPDYGLQEWLEKVYFDGAQKQNVTPEVITRLGQAIGKLLYFEPCARASREKF
ncbi:hypothetical protein N7467_004596 [Penicillium canescens]|nr:hypothetical protein N7467_004596 [Penicillium canescens]